MNEITDQELSDPELFKALNEGLEELKSQMTAELNKPTNPQQQMRPRGQGLMSQRMKFRGPERKERFIQTSDARGTLLMYSQFIPGQSPHNSKIHGVQRVPEDQQDR